MSGKTSNKNYLLGATIATLVLIVLCVIGVAKVIREQTLSELYVAGAMFVLISLVFGFIYLILGYSKMTAPVYKIAIAVAALNALLVTTTSVNEPTVYISIASCAICFGLYCVLLFAKDLGKQKSLIICGAIVFIRAIGLFSNIASYGSLTSNEVILIGAQLALAIVITLITIGKYIDKKSRGTN